jgi:rubrerythrin
VFLWHNEWAINNVLFKNRFGVAEMEHSKKDYCLTRELALEKAIELEHQSFAMYLKAYKIAKDAQAKKLLKELALDELEHKYSLEKAFFEDTVSLHDEGSPKDTSMKLSLLIQEKPLKVDSSPQDVLAYAIHDEKRSIDFYAEMTQQCKGAPMEQIFNRLLEDETGHLAKLEELYEKSYMQQM